MTVCYLDVDDEITDAVARLRTTSDRRFILVLAPGSRVATSRINFRLLVREGQERDVMVGMVSGEPGVRSLAISAGMPAYATVDEAEGALAVPLARQAAETGRGSMDDGSLTAGSTSTGIGTFGTSPIPDARPVLPSEPMVEQARRAAAGPRPSTGAPSPKGSLTPEVSAPPAAGAPSAPAATPDERARPDGDLEATRIVPRSGASLGVVRAPAASRAAAPQVLTQGNDPRSDHWEPGTGPGRVRSRRRGRGVIGGLVRLTVIAAVLGGALYAAYLYLPNVSVSLTPMTRTAGPVTIEVTADPGVAVAEPEAGIVPAERIDVPLSATDQFPATGSEIEQTRATGTVRFTSENTLFEVPIPEGTRLTTAGGEIFETTQSVTISEASFESGPSTAQAPIRAATPGPSGNVEAETITRVPAPIEAQLVRVTNPQATSGGQRVETRVVTRADYDAALAVLDDVLDAQLETALADPTTTPRGLRLFPETAVRERLTTGVAAGDLVGQVSEGFSLSAESRGTVLAVDESGVAEMAADRLEAQMPAGTRLFLDSVETSVGEARLMDGLILYEVEAVGERYEPVDHADLVAAIRGRTLSEARAILAAYGSVTISPWPDFIDTVPDDARRINLTVLEPQRRSP
ncbi:MAG: baseplate J/gp47 family protein [Chloroflexi bacterium]|nr:baseplate J/gp47 family protein [Chloroflexota bacterium]